MFNLFDYLYPFLGGTSAAHVLNLVNPSMYPITWYGSPTHSANGVEFNGVNQYGNTGFNANNRIRDDRFFFSYGDNYASVLYNGNYGAWEAATSSGNYVGINSGGIIGTVAANNVDHGFTLNGGKMIAINLKSNTRKVYASGTLISTVADTRVSPNGNIYIGMINDISHPTMPGKANFGRAWRAKCLGFGASLTASQHILLSNATTALQTALSRA